VIIPTDGFLDHTTNNKRFIINGSDHEHAAVCQVLIAAEASSPY